MRALAAVVILAACSFRCRALTGSVPSTSHDSDIVFRHLLSLLGVSPRSAVQNAFECSQSIGPSRCLAALSIWRAEKALDSFRNQNSTKLNFSDDIQKFPWKAYINTSQDEIEKQLGYGTENLLKYKALKFQMVSGYDLELASNGHGTLTVDILRGQPSDSSRGMKKTFYNIVPYLLLPGLLMSAILPFMLPALKLMTFAAGMLNNMALSGAIFTILRNNAFNDKYEKKVIYVNEGYRNEETAYKNHDEPAPDIIYEMQYDGKHNQNTLQGYQSVQVENIAPEYESSADFDNFEKSPSSVSNSDWLKQYYGHRNNHNQGKRKIIKF